MYNGRGGEEPLAWGHACSGIRWARVETAFAEWRAGRPGPQEVSAAIHAFHDGVARDLWVLYHRIDPSSTVPRANAAGLLAEGELPPPILEKLQNALEFYRHQRVESRSDQPAVQLRHLPCLQCEGLRNRAVLGKI